MSDTRADSFNTGARTGWEAAMLEVEHQAEHWDTLEHGDTGHLIACALRAAVEIARGGGLQCEHRAGSHLSGPPVWSGSEEVEARRDGAQSPHAA